MEYRPLWLVKVEQAPLYALWQQQRLYQACSDWFSASEWQQLERFPVLKRKMDWVAGRLAAKAALLLSKPGLESSGPLCICYDGHGRPYYGSQSLSISHHRLWAAAAVGPGVLGLDAECIGSLPCRDLSPWLEADEIRLTQVGWHCSEATARTLLWSLKEALFKAEGAGAFFEFARSVRLLFWSSSRCVLWHKVHGERELSVWVECSVTTVLVVYAQVNCPKSLTTRRKVSHV